MNDAFNASGDQDRKEVHFHEATKDDINKGGSGKGSSKQKDTNEKGEVKDSHGDKEKESKEDKEGNSSVSATSPKRKTTAQVAKVKKETKKKADKKPRAEEKVEVFIDDLQALPHVLRMDSESEGRADSSRLCRLNLICLTSLPRVIIIIV